MNPEDVERLCKKSYWLTRSKWKWRKLCQRKGISWIDIEKLMDVTIDQDDKIFKAIMETRKDEQERALSRNKKSREYSDTGEVRSSGVEGKERRSEETNDESVTTSGVK